MARYRKKPIEVEAVQWFRGDISGEPKEVRGVFCEILGEDRAYYVVTIHGQRAYLASGDWVITEPDGEHHYPCKPDYFEKTYDSI